MSTHKNNSRDKIRISFKYPTENISLVLKKQFKSLTVNELTMFESVKCHSIYPKKKAFYLNIFVLKYKQVCSTTLLMYLKTYGSVANCRR